jgi:DNA-binding NarL/FixJ family response regulator
MKTKLSPFRRHFSALLVDDSAIIRKRVRHLIQEEARLMQVIEADCAVDGWLLFKFMHPDVVVLDLQLPDFSGMELLRRIKMHSPSCLLVILSNCREPEVQAECLRLGADHVLHKSSEFDKLHKILSGMP